MAKHWYKILAVICIAFSIVAGFLMPVPRMPILHETIRNLYFHVPMWFAMIVLGAVSAYNSVQYIRTNTLKYDTKAESYMLVALMLGIAGLITGMLWAKYTWGKPWSWDVKQNATAISLMLMFAYFILRNSMDDITKQARISAVYNIFSYSAIIPLIFIVPRLTDSLHPGMGGNPAFSKYDLDSNMRFVFYPAVIGWILFSFWLADIIIRIKNLKEKNA